MAGQKYEEPCVLDPAVGFLLSDGVGEHDIAT